MKILILGCGPAGLMAAHAAVIEGNDVVIVSKNRKSHLYGAQYLHAPIPGMTEQPAIDVQYVLNGTPEQYRDKVYGPDSRVQVSPETLVGIHPGWDIRSTYDNLWNEYSKFIIDGLVDSTSLRYAMESWKPDFTVSTIPAFILCSEPQHAFTSESVWAIGDAPQEGVECKVRMQPNTVVCNGEDVPAWYRASNVFGHCTAEWPARRKPPFGRPAAVQKPVDTTCQCYPEVQRLGRYGQWKKGVLSHEAFFQMQGMLRGEIIEIPA